MRPISSAVLAAIFAGFLTLSVLQAAEPRPNVIVIVTDDHGYYDLSIQGNRDLPTPNIDALAKSGVRFTNGYVSHPFCSPTRAGLMTGRYQQRFGHENNPRYDPADEIAGLPTGETTIADLMRKAGYVTGAVGKWHLGGHPKFHPNRRGFDEFYGFLGGGHKYHEAARPGEKRAGAEYWIPIERNGEPQPFEGYLTDMLSREASAFVKRHRDEPFFLYLAYNAPHTPLECSPKYLDRFKHLPDEQQRIYYGMISAIDDGVGQLLATLEETGLRRRTLIFLFSDNGGTTVVPASRNDPLRGHKGQVYEGGMRVPLFASWPGTLPAGVTYDQPVIALDVLPTALAAAGAQPPASLKLDGVNILPYVLGKKTGSPHDRLHWRTGGGQSWAVRQGDWKLLKAGKGEPELYNLREDIAEAKNLASSEPDRVAALQKLHDAWNAELIDPLFQSPRPAKKAKPKK